MRKIYFITGASSDIGMVYIRHLDSSLKGENAILLVHYHRMTDSLRECLDGIDNLEVVEYQADFSKTHEVERMLEWIEEKGLLPTHMLYLAAEPLTYRRIAEINIESLKESLEVQLIAASIIFSHVLPNMAKHKFGRVVLLLSSCTIGMPPKFMSEYVVTKYAMLGLLKAAACEYGDQGININGLSPSMVETKFLKNVGRRIRENSAEGNPKHRNLLPQDLLESIDFLLSDTTEFLNGENLNLSGGTVI